MFIHVVSPGESLFGIASSYGVTVSSIMQVNELPSPSQIVPGLALVIPSVVLFHIVRPGESLWSIAQMYAISADELAAANSIDSGAYIYPGDVLRIPQKVRPVIEVNAYIYMLGQQAAPIVRDAGRYLTYLSPFAYLIREDGNLQPIEDVPAIQAAISVGAVPMMSITNFTSTARGENLASVVLNSPQIIESLLNNIVRIMRQKGYRGLNIDFENVLPADRVAYNNFLETAVSRLHREGYFVSTALAPKISTEQAGLLYEAHDYEAHGRIADFVVLMTYEWGWRGGPPQAISPINEMRRVLDYAVTLIPKNKILLGFQIYARDWLVPHMRGQEAETFSNQEAVRRAIRYGAVIQFDPVSQSPFFRYVDEQGRGHEVWFEDARSAQAKFDLVKEYDLRGISYWALGYPFPQNWALLDDNFIITKL
ncbi:MAG: LysM peptidoglycan-binding domain-containing protein [Clostridiaceae bacterium]|nr:LysM peptidoglycan-binding domain-containing protein [Clostridiaceae bacterium]